MNKVGIIGGSGFAGEELIRFLLNHDSTTVLAVSSRDRKGHSVSEIAQGTDLVFVDPDDNVFFDCDIIFFATPHGVSMTSADSYLKQGIKVIDLSADFRIKDTKLWKEWYGTEHKDPSNLTEAVYGLTELNLELIKRSKLIAVPGCYPTASILGLLPMIKSGFKISNISIDAKSGISGAGRSRVENGLKDEINENFRAYATNGHRHLPEISQILEESYGSDLQINFLPHLIPAMRGIYATIHINFGEKVKSNFNAIYKEFYKNSPNVILLEEDTIPETLQVSHTNNCQIGIYPSAIENQLIIISAIDNLVKGAAGQAIECYNLMCGSNQLKGLRNG